MEERVPTNADSIPIRGSPELERIEMASFISGANNTTGIRAGLTVLAQKTDVGYPVFSGIPISDANSPLMQLTDQSSSPLVARRMASSPGPDPYQPYQPECLSPK